MVHTKCVSGVWQEFREGEINPLFSIAENDNAFPAVRIVDAESRHDVDDEPPPCCGILAFGDAEREGKDIAVPI